MTDNMTSIMTGSMTASSKISYQIILKPDKPNRK
jgi:hypothetical protein